MAKSYQPFIYPKGTTQAQDAARTASAGSLVTGSRIPSAPRALSVTPGALKATVSWLAPQVDDGATGWRVYLDTENNLVAKIDDRSQRQADVTLDDMKIHNIFVSSVNAAKRESKKVVIQAAAVGFESSTALNPQGNIVPNQAIIFSYSFTENSISISWVAQTMKRGDGSILNIQAGSKNYTGLSASTAYYLYSYVRAKDGVLDFANDTPPSTTPNATKALDASLDGRIALAVKIVTTSSVGGPGGGGTGGGGDVCPDAPELVMIEGRGEAAALDAQLGERILGYSFEKQQDVYRKIIGKSEVPCAAWRLIDGHRVSPCEPVYRDGWIPAFRVPESTFDGKNGTKVLITVESDEYSESNFWLVADKRLLIHNNLPAEPC